MFKGMGILAVSAIVILLIVFVPFITIWSFNTLFPLLTIPYTLETWFAVIVLGMFFKSNVSVSKK